MATPQFPKITVVTPSFNQGHFIEETILSVLAQNYPNLEYIVIDGGSTDETLEVLRRYDSSLTYWVSEKDRGQSHAINKGFQRATGDVMAWLNSDDLYAPGTLHAVAESFAANPTAQWLVGNVDNFHSQSPAADEPWPFNDSKRLVDWVIRDANPHQPGIFWKRNLFLKHGYLNEDWHYCFDAEFWCRLIAADIYPLYVHKTFARFRLHANSKTCSLLPRFHAENVRLAQLYQGQVPASDRATLYRHITYSRFAGCKMAAKLLVAQGKPLGAISTLMHAMFHDYHLLVRGSMYLDLLTAVPIGVRNKFRRSPQG